MARTAGAKKSAPIPSVWRQLAFLTRKIHGPKLTQTFEREVFFVVSAGFAAFYYIAIASFNPTDASAVTGTFPEMAASNLAGAIGAELAGIAIFAFGATAALLPLPLLGSALLLLKNQEKPFGFARIIGWTLAFLAAASLVAARAPIISIKGFELPGGGLVGEALLAFTNAWLGKVGSIIVLATAATTAVLLVFQRSLLLPTWGYLRTQWRSSKEDKNGTDASQESIVVTQPTTATEPEVECAIPEPKITVPSTLAVTPPEIEISSDSARGLFARLQNPSTSKDTPETKPQKSELQGEKVAAYVTPPLSIFHTGDTSGSQYSRSELESTGQLLVKTFADFGVTGKIVGYQPGPVVTVYEFQPDAGVKQSKILGLVDDLALALKVDSIFVHPVPGKRALGVQVPNSKRETVYLGDVLATAGFQEANSTLTFGLGKTISGQPLSADLTSMPHLLMAGATGAGKSVAINALLCSVIMKATPNDVRMILVDPKMLELSVYEGIPHLLMPVITEPQRASLALKWAANEMERRYKLMQHAAVRNISGFNSFWAQASKDRKREITQLMNDESIGKLPYILIVIDELADLMLMAPKDVESSIQRLAQKARASGIHMVLATQRPSVDIITGVIKANLPCRISFQVVSKHDSRTILDMVGAEKLLGKGDMLFQRPGISRLERVQGALISDEEVLNLVAAAKTSAKADYDDSIMSWIDDELLRSNSTDGDGTSEGSASMDDDPKYDEAIGVAKAHGVVSASFLQRHLKIGYNRAARIVEFMESQGLVAKAEGSKPRRWLGPTL